MTEESCDVFSADRSVAALNWLQELLSDNLTEAEVEKHLSGIQPTPAIVRTIESLRSFLTKRVEAEQEANKQIERQTHEYEMQLERWKQAGSERILERLDRDAIEEVDVLSDICAALQLTPEDSISKGRRIAAITRIAGDYLQAQHHLAERECALAEAQGVLRGAAEEMGRSARALTDITDDVKRRGNEKTENARKANTLEAKASQYEFAADEHREIVRRSGVKRNTTHEAVAKQGERLRELEKQLAEVEKDLEVYGDFPTVSLV